MPKQQDIALASEVRTAISRLKRQFRKQDMKVPVSITEQTTLVLLDQHREMLPSALAAIEKVTAQAMSQSLNHLQQLGYIKRTQAPDDKRKVLVSLSREGSKVLDQIRNARSEWLSKAIDALLTADEKKALKQAAGILQRLADYEGA